MTQLADDCFAFGEPLMPMADALAILRQRLVPVTGSEEIALADGLNRILAADVIAAADVPLRDNAAVDGYALSAGNLAAGVVTELRVVGRVAAGHPTDRALQSGEAMRIFTGAVMPAGADAVVMQEDVNVDGDLVRVPAGLKPGSNRRRAGEDSRAGDVVLPGGRRLQPQDLALAASVGCARLTVRQPLRVAVFSTGDELREPDVALSVGATHDANRYMLRGLLQALGVAVDDLGILPDRPEAVRAALAAATATHDVLITSGGVSTGDEDYIRAVVAELGHLHFWRLAIKPGRPVALGQIDDTAFIGLPGNPVAVMVCFLRFARPLILGLAGAHDLEPQHYRVPAAFTMDKKAGRREFLRAQLVTGADGRPAAARFARQGSGVITSLVRSDGLVELAEDVTQVKDGDMVDFLPFDEVLW